MHQKDQKWQQIGPALYSTLDFSQDEEDRQAFVERIRSLVQETGARILALALMGDHVHLAGINEPAGPPEEKA